MLATLISLLEKDIPANFKHSAQFFWVLAKFAQMGIRQCRQLFDLNAFPQMVKFMLGVEPVEDEAEGGSKAKSSDEATTSPTRRRWTSLQSREFGELHRALAFMILACNTDPLKDGSDGMGKIWHVA